MCQVHTVAQATVVPVERLAAASSNGTACAVRSRPSASDSSNGAKILIQRHDGLGNTHSSLMPDSAWNSAALSISMGVYDGLDSNDGFGISYGSVSWSTTWTSSEGNSQDGGTAVWRFGGQANSGIAVVQLSFTASKLSAAFGSNLNSYGARGFANDTRVSFSMRATAYMTESVVLYGSTDSILLKEPGWSRDSGCTQDVTNTVSKQLCWNDP